LEKAEKEEIIEDQQGWTEGFSYCGMLVKGGFAIIAASIWIFLG
jgi:hypothetical protein